MPFLTPASPPGRLEPGAVESSGLPDVREDARLSSLGDDAVHVLEPSVTVGGDR